MKKNSEKPRSKVSQVWNQARESLKLLETLEKETIAKAKTFVRNPLPANRKRLTNEKILASLKSLGVATRSEVETLQLKVAQLETEIATLTSAIAQLGNKRIKAQSKAPQSTAEAFPNT